ncbi:thermonuclease family protein [Roseofilum casamattae]|uniref:Thermonuclease family protein n=1 Tax=Roseofilum casamattae BLCC-M143 TaxID=3022442 RepID=A0ABT7C0Q8_9CYAN|nr:thermonuclease family protein [Roseofilum casamattae]MDJ1184324.1 thermonuclease family protein [Roseofilum casamattae BLCC-M143]
MTRDKPIEGTEEEIHLNSQMTMDGMAWHYERYSGNCPNQMAIADGEAIAKGQSVGIWNTANPVTPWEWWKSN